MGMYLNPGNSGFAEILESDYVDKTGLISLINSTIGTKKKLTCISRPRRFGKSYAAQMLCAYYDKSCDSHELFAGYEIARDHTYEKHIGKYDVIYLDMTNLLGKTPPKKLTSYIEQKVLGEIKQTYPEIDINDSFDAVLLRTTAFTGNKFIMIIDEWDAPIRETPEIEQDYLKFLRMLFKSSSTTPKIFAAAYMTGILPIKKDGSQSAISDFREYSMVKPRQFGEYAGFTEEEVRKLCEEHHIRFDLMRQWYDGYDFKDIGPVYNPNSVMQAIENNDFDSYWTETSAAEGLMEYISKPYNGMARTIAELIGGVDVRVNTNGFANDLTTFRGKDDVLTLMIHLGYLAYDSEAKTARIPNEEIKLEFERAIWEVSHEETAKRLNESKLEELPSGEGYADIVYLPRRGSGWPALVIELKWNKSADGAIEQILDRKYPDVLKGYGGEILLVGINYDKDAPIGERKHSCRIREWSPGQG